MLGTWQLARPAARCHCRLSAAGGPTRAAQQHGRWEHTGRRRTPRTPPLPRRPSGKGHSLTLSLCSMNSARFRRVCVTSAMSCEVRASSMLLMSSSCWSSFSSDQQDTNAALKRSLEAQGARGCTPAQCQQPPASSRHRHCRSLTEPCCLTELVGCHLTLPREAGVTECLICGKQGDFK